MAESIRLSVSSIRTRARAMRAERQTQRDLARAQRRASHQHVRQVRAADEQHRHDRGHQHPQGQPQLRSHDAIDVAIDGRAPALLESGYRAAIPAAIALISACACSNETPRFRRATALR